MVDPRLRCFCGPFPFERRRGRWNGPKLDNFDAEFKRLKQECAADFQKLSLDADSIIKLDIDKAPLAKRRDALIANKEKIDTALSATVPTSLLAQKTACLDRLNALQEKLDAPNKQYQAYQGALKAWEQQKLLIEGDTDKADTLKYFEAQLKYVKEQLPAEIEAIKRQITNIARKAHETIGAIKEAYEELFAPVQELIESSVIIKEGFKLTFNSSIIERTFQRQFLDTYINPGVAGSFCGKDKGAAMLEELRAEYDFNKTDDAIAFAQNRVPASRYENGPARKDEYRRAAPQARRAAAVL
jgi:predicted  nucleic acid-binding Zn-ribbon protein